MTKTLLIIALILIVIVLEISAIGLRRSRDSVITDWARVKSILDNEQKELDSLRWINDSLTIANKRLEVQLDTNVETGYYLVVDREAKKFQLRKGQMIIREGICAVGKGFTSRGNRDWNFETPAGERKIISKNENPAWHRPSWYWHERGKSVPSDFITFSPNMPEDERREAYRIMSNSEQELVKSVPGALGRYSLGLGDGYFIHYGKELGRAASHGCIRVGAEDLEVIYQALEIGAPVFIY